MKQIKNFNLNAAIMAGTIVIGLLGFSCKQPASMPVNNTYKTLVISRTDKKLYSFYSASIQGKQDVDIYPQISGLLTKVCVNEGDDVKKGETLFIIDQVPYLAAVKTAEANVKSAEAEVATARLTVESKQELYNANVISEIELKTAVNSLRSAEAALAQAEAALVTAQNDLSYTEIKSPVDGRTSMISFREGALVSPSMASPLVSVSDNEEMYVYFSITEKQLLDLTKVTAASDDSFSDMPAVELQLSDGSLYSEKGKIDAISGVIDPQTGAITIRAVFPNPGHLLRSGGSGQIKLPHDRQGCIVIPQAATFELQDKILVYKIVDGKTKSTPVTVYPLNDGQEYIVETGLSVGDTIVSEGAGLLREGLTIGNNQSSQSMTLKQERSSK